MAKRNTSTVEPRLRFPHFRKSEGWKPSQLGSSGRFFRGLTYSASDVQSHGLLVLRSTNIQDGTLVLDKDLVFVGKGCSPDQIIQPGDVAICMSNGSKALVGKSAEFQGNYSGQLTVGAFCSIFHPSLLFAKLAFQTERYADFVTLAIGGGNINNLKNSDLESFEFAIPASSTEQQKIADCLTSLDEVITAQGRKVELLKAHKRGLMQQLFAREGEARPRLRFPESRKAPEWELKKIGGLLEETSRPMEMDDDEEYSLVTVKRRYGGVVFRERLKGRSIKVKSQFFIRTNDSLISKRQIVHDACGLVPQDLGGSIVSNEYSVLGPKNHCDIEFVNYFSQQPVVSTSFLQSSVGIVIEKMLFKLNIWLNLEFRFPSIGEQLQIAGCLKSADEQITAESNQLTTLRTHKQGLMQQLFPAPQAAGV